MSQERIRHLAAVWFADIVGYTSLSTRDEDAALAVVDEFQKQSLRVVEGRGRVVKFLGDGALAAFDSTNAALESALALQAAFAHSAVATQHGCSLSVGLHVGEVVESEDGDMYGDGVNVAARIESAAGAGQIVFSEDVYRQVRNRTAYHPRPFGEHRLKGLDQALLLYVLGEDPQAASGNGASAASQAPRAQTGEYATEWAPLPVGASLRGRYVIESLLGRGGFGATYRANDRGRFGAACAVKEFAPGSGVREDAIVRFEREAVALVALKHEGIPRLHEFFAEGRRYFLVQDLVEGEDLTRVVARRGPLPETEVRSILRQLLVILQYLHGREPPVVHRDVKPANIILGEDERIRLVDFGAVRDALGAEVAEPVSTVFTPGYASVEQLGGQVTPRNDLFAAGATALYLLTGAPPSGLPGFGDPLFLLTGRTSASAEFEGFIEQLMRGAQSLYPTADAALSAVSRMGTGETAATTVIPAARPGAVTAGSPGASQGTASRPGLSKRAPRSRAGGRRRIALFGTGASVALGALAVTLMSEPEARSAQPDDLASTASQAGAVAQPPGPAAALPPVAGAADDRDAALPLDAVARSATASGLAIEVRHPVGWPIVSVPTDQHVAIRDPMSGALFLAGIDAMPGIDIPPRSFVERWTATTAQRYATVRVAATDPPMGNAWPYRLDLTRSSQSVERGTMLVTPFTQIQDNNTLFRWWATLGQTDASTATMRAIAGTLEVVGLADTRAR